MKRLNRKKLIEEFEFLRQGFKDAYEILTNTNVAKISMAAYHANANRCVCELGGESVSLKQFNLDTLELEL